MLHTVWQGILALVIGGLTTFIALPLMADFYATTNWDNTPARGIELRDNTMQLWQFIPLFVGAAIFASMLFRISRKETTEEEAFW